MKEVIIIILLWMLFFRGAFSFEPDKSIISFPAKSTEGVFDGDKLIFNLIEATYIPEYKIKYIDKALKNEGTVESAVVSRFSAIAARDLEWWKSSWASEEESQESLAIVLSSGVNVNSLLERWGNIADFNDLSLVRKVSYQDYRIVTYRITSKESDKQMQAVELPIVLKKNKNSWKVTSDLSRSSLMGHMPWITGRYVVVEEDSLWVLK